MRRRAVLLLTAMVASLMLASGVAPEYSRAQAQIKPNIIFVLTDDQFPGTENEMPALKSNVTNQGVTFSNMTSTFPLCCPARATIQRGQYAHNTHITGNSPPKGGWSKFRNRSLQKDTVATWLRGADYHTGLFGKYMNNYRDKVIPPGWERWYAWNGPKEGWTSVNDQGHERPLKRPEADTLVADKALEFLGNRLGDNDPVFAFVNFGAAHTPYEYPKLDANKFEGEAVPRTLSFNEDDVSDKPSYISDKPRLSKQAISRQDQSYRESLRSLMRVDRFIADVTDLVRRKGEMDNTYFVFYTDNGIHFGQHRLRHGKLQPITEDVNFPLIIRGPGIREEGEPAVNTQLVGAHDIAPTLATIGDATIPPFVDGRSFLDIAKDPNTSWPRTAILSEVEDNLVAPNKWDMLRMPDAIYTRHNMTDEREYYDLAVDPYQLHNALGPSDTAYPPPDSKTLEYYEKRLDRLYDCKGQDGYSQDGSLSCPAAEDLPLHPEGTTP